MADNSPTDIGFFRRIRSSIISDPVVPQTEKERKRYLIRNLVFHFRPSTVPQETLRFTLTFGLGGMAAVLVLIQFITGVMLKFVYEPTPVAAYASVQALIHLVPFGRLIRNLHHWCANLLVLIMLLHMLRVFLTGAFHPPRQFNWIIGICLFLMVLVSNFTGYLLPWDQLAYWAVTVSTGMLEYIPWIGALLQNSIRVGSDIGPGTLRMFFAVHTAVVPVLLIVMMAFHFWRVRKSGGLVIPRQPDQSPVERPVRVATIPHLILREVVVATVLIAAVLLWSIIMNAPLADPANPGLSPNPTKAPWYFAGFQEMLMHLHPVFAVCILPILLVTAFLAIPYLPYDTDTKGVWFASPTGRRTAVNAVVLALVIIPALILLDEWLMGPGSLVAGISPVITNGILPVVLFVVIVIVFTQMLKKRHAASFNERVQAVFVLLITSFAILTLVNLWFRGEGMVLTVPW